MTTFRTDVTLAAPWEWKVKYRCDSCNEIVSEVDADGGVVLYDTEQSVWRMFCFPCGDENPEIKTYYSNFGELAFFMDDASTQEKFDEVFERRISSKRPDLLRATLANMVMYKDEPRV